MEYVPRTNFKRVAREGAKAIALRVCDRGLYHTIKFAIKIGGLILKYAWALRDKRFGYGGTNLG